MKYHKSIGVSLFIIFSVWSCQDSHEDPQPISGGIVEVLAYNETFFTYNNDTVKIDLDLKGLDETGIDILLLYKKFNSPNQTSDWILHDSIVTASEIEGNTVYQNFIGSNGVAQRITYPGSIAVLQYDETQLMKDAPETNIVDLPLSSSISFHFKALKDGIVVAQNNPFTIEIKSVLEGNWIVIESIYGFNSTGPRGNWNGNVKAIEALGGGIHTLSYLGPWEESAERVGKVYFKVELDNSITILEEYNGKTLLAWGADSIISCNEDISNLPCVNQLDRNENGEFELSLVYGYKRTSGQREFYEKLVKID